MASIKQTATYASAVSETSGTVTLGTAPVAGNFLVGSMSYWDALTATIPAGFTLLGDANGNADAHLKYFFRQVVSGDGSSYAFSLSSADFFSVCLVEVEATEGIDVHSVIGASGGAATSVTTSSINPTITGGLAVTFFSENFGLSQNASIAASLPAGWTVTANPRPDFNSGAVGRKDTASTLTGESVTWSTNTAGALVAAMVVMKPAAAAAAATSSSNFFLLF